MERLFRQSSSRRSATIAARHPVSSDTIKATKEIINGGMAHANLLSADNTFRVNDAERSFDAPFFDFEDEHYVKTDFWMIGNVAAGPLRLFHDVNKSHGALKFADDFPLRLDKLARDSKSLHAAMTASERYKAVDCGRSTSGLESAASEVKPGETGERR
jgi:hypothetical protein